MILVATHGPTSRNIPALPPLFDLEAMKAFFNNTLRSWNNGRLIIFLDGVNHLDDSDGGRVLDWLPVDGLSAMVSFVFVHLRTHTCKHTLTGAFDRDNLVCCRRG